MQRSTERPLFTRFVPWLTAALCLFGVLVLTVTFSTQNVGVALVGAMISLQSARAISAWVIYLDRSPYITPLESLRSIVEWIVCAVAFIVVTVLFFAVNPFVAICWLALVFYLGAFAFRYRQSQRRALLDLMSRAADRGMPLGAGRSCVRRVAGALVRRARQGAGRIVGGGPSDGRRPLPEIAALLPPQSELAARLGETTGALGATLRAADTRRNGPVRNGSLFPVRWASIIVVLAAGRIASFRS